MNAVSRALLWSYCPRSLSSRGALHSIIILRVMFKVFDEALQLFPFLFPLLFNNVVPEKEKLLHLHHDCYFLCKIFLTSFRISPGTTYLRAFLKHSCLRKYNILKREKTQVSKAYFPLIVLYFRLSTYTKQLFWSFQ